MIIWKIEVEDLTNLGGLMGTEYVTSLGTQLFKTEQEAITFMNKKSKNQLKHITKLKVKGYFDCRWIGFRYSKEVL